MNLRKHYDELHKQYKLNPEFYLNKSNLSEDITKVIDDHITNKTRALDIGCGGGHLSAYLAHKGLSTVSIDFLEVALDSARSNYTFLNLCCVDAQTMAFRDNSFDLIISLDTIEHLPNLAEHFDEVNRILKSGSSYIIKTPTRWIDKAYYLLLRKGVEMEHCSLCNTKDLRGYAKRY